MRERLSKRPTALVVDDAEDLTIIYASALQSVGFQTKIIMDGNTAVAHLKEQVPDIIILDLHLPGLSGVEILNLIREDERLLETKVFVVTADLILAHDLQKKGELVLTKPIGFRKMRDMLSRLVES